MNDSAAATSYAYTSTVALSCRFTRRIMIPVWVHRRTLRDILLGADMGVHPPVDGSSTIQYDNDAWVCKL